MDSLDFTYELKLSFSAPVCSHSFILRCLPKEDMSQKCSGLKVDIAPYGSLWESGGQEGRSILGNIPFAHDLLTANVSGRVYSFEGADRTYPHVMYSCFTDLTAPSGKLREAARAFMGRKRDYALALDVAAQVHDAIEYKAGATDSDTTAAVAYEKKAGVCQDFAHVYCSVMRLLKVPTRYVAGLGSAAGESHAWNECYIDGRWRAIDPTNLCSARHGYVKFAVGTDARHCALNRGVFSPLEGARVVQSRSVKAKVTNIED